MDDAKGAVGNRRRRALPSRRRIATLFPTVRYLPPRVIVSVGGSGSDDSGRAESKPGVFSCTARGVRVGAGLYVLAARPFVRIAWGCARAR